MELEQENAFYAEHRAEFREKYMDKWLVITGGTLWGVYGRFTEAVDAALENLEPGKIMIHKPADDGKVISIGGRACAGYPGEADGPEPETAYTTLASCAEPVVIPYD